MRAMAYFWVHRSHEELFLCFQIANIAPSSLPALLPRFMMYSTKDSSSSLQDASGLHQFKEAMGGEEDIHLLLMVSTMPPYESSLPWFGPLSGLFSAPSCGLIVLLSGHDLLPSPPLIIPLPPLKFPLTLENHISSFHALPAPCLVPPPPRSLPTPPIR